MTNKVYIITSAKHEELYIEEWIKYHLNLGFDKIIINDNNEKDYPYNISNILKKYIDNGTVIVERYYDTHELTAVIQENEIFKPYTWLYNKYKNEFDWCAKLDIDEYLEIPETNNDIKKFVYQEKFNNTLSIIIPWKVYEIKWDIHVNYFRTECDRDKYYYEQGKFKHYGYSFKSIIKSTDLCEGIFHHIAHFNKSNDSYCYYCYPNGVNLNDTKFGEININYDRFSECIPDQQYIYNLIDICHINHYDLRSYEERANKLNKIELYKINDYWKSVYDDLYKQNPDFFDNPRDLYKIYFLDNK